MFNVAVIELLELNLNALVKPKAPETLASESASIIVAALALATTFTLVETHVVPLSSDTCKVKVGALAMVGITIRARRLAIVNVAEVAEAENATVVAAVLLC